MDIKWAFNITVFNITVLSNTQFNALTAEIHDFVIHYFAYRVTEAS